MSVTTSVCTFLQKVVSIQHKSILIWIAIKCIPANIVSDCNTHVLFTDQIEEVPRMFVIIEELHIAILGCTDSTNLSMMDH